MKRKPISALALGVVLLSLTPAVVWAIPQAERAALIALHNSTHGDSWPDNSGWAEPPRREADGFAASDTEWNRVGGRVGIFSDPVGYLALEVTGMTKTLPREMGHLARTMRSAKVPTGIVSFTARPTTIHLGESSTLSWNIEGETTASIDQGIGSVNPSSGSVSVSPTATTTYTLTAGSYIAQVTVTLSIPPSERAALIALYDSTNGDSWPSNWGWKEEPLSDDGFARPGTEWLWAGVGVDFSSYHVKGITLGGSGIAGTLPRELGNLTELKWLDINDTGISGPIPRELGRLTLLEILQLQNNQLSGPIPGELASLGNLRSLVLDGNRVAGAIPSWLGSLSKLEQLALYDNRFSGPIPGELGNLANCKYLILGLNRLTGPIPRELGRLAKLENLYLTGNYLSGPIPPELGNLANLWQLTLADNELSGPIPKELGSLVNLKNLWLGGNMFSGAVPKELTGLTRLERFDISFNALFTTDPAVADFLSGLQFDWRDTQTVAPADGGAAFGDFSLQVSWGPILYTGNEGGYMLYHSVDGAPYALVTTTRNKTVTGATIGGLNLPDHAHCFYLQSFTLPHSYNENNTVISDVSTVFSPDSSCRCPPVIDIRSPENNAYVDADSLVTILVLAKGKSGITKVDLYIDDQHRATLTGEPYIWTWDTTGLLGEYRIRAVATEAAGLTNQTVNVVHVAEISHDLPPQVDIVSPRAGTSIRGGQVLVQADAFDDQGIAKVEFYVNQQLRATVTTAPYQWIWDTPEAGGSFAIRVVAYDTIAQTGVDDLAVSVKPLDNEPAVAIVAPAPNATVFGPVGIRCDAFDDKGVAKVEIYVDDVLKTTRISRPYSFTWDSTGLNGPHTFKAIVYDTADQTGQAAIPVTVDTALMPPAITVQPQDQLIRNLGSATLSVTAVGGEPLTYQWYRVEGGNAVKIDGAVASIYQTPALTEASLYFVEVANPYGKVPSVTAKVAIDQTSRLEGVVWDGALKRPLADVGLAFENLAVVTTDVNGHYEIPALQPGDYKVRLIKGGFNELNLTVGVPGCSLVLKDFTLLPNGGAIVVDSLSSKYKGFVYFLEGRNHPVTYTAHVDWAGHPQGRVRFTTSRGNQDVPIDEATNTAKIDLTIQDEFIGCGTLRAVAVSTDGTQSAEKAADFRVVATPFPMPGFAGWNVVEGSDGFLYHGTGGVNFPFIDKKIDGEMLKNRPFLSKGALFTQYLPTVDATFKSSGEYELTRVHDNTPLKEDNQVLFGFAGVEGKIMPRMSFKAQFSPDCTVQCWGTMGLSGSVEKKSVWPFYVIVGPSPPIPMFFKATFNVTIDAMLGVKSFQPFAVDCPLVIKPSVRGSLGAGIDDVVALEGWVQGGFEFTVLPEQKVNYYFSAGVTATAWILKYEYEGFKWEGNWPQTTRLGAKEPEADKLRLGKPRLLDRDYLSLPEAGRFWPKPPSFPLTRQAEAQPAAAECAPLQTAGFPFSEPCLSTSGTRTGLVWLTDDTSRGSADRTMAVFSRYDGNGWSAPQPVADDGTADFHPQLRMFADGSAVAAWENESSALADTAGLEDIAAGMTIAAAVYNATSQTWGAAQRLGQVGILNRSPKLAGQDRGQALLAWIANEANDTRGGFNTPNQIRFATCDGANWSERGEAAQVSLGIVKYSLAGDARHAWLAMAVDTDNDPSTVADHEIYLLEYRDGAWGGLTPLTQDNLPDENPQLALDPSGRPVMVWVKGNEVCTVVGFDLAHPRTIMADEFSSELGDFKLTASATGRLAVVWAEPSHYGSDLHALFYEPTSEIWSSGGTQLTFDPETERRLTASFCDDNTLLAVYDRNQLGLKQEKRDASDEASAADDIPVVIQTDLYMLKYTLGQDLALDPATFACFPGNPAPGSIATLSVTVANAGAKPAANTLVAFYQGDPAAGGTRLGEARIAETLKPGDRKEVSVRVPIPEAAASVRFTAVVDPDAAIDADCRLNNTAVLELMRPDLEVVNLVGEPRPDSRTTVLARVGNTGVVASGPTTVRFRRDSPYGALLSEQCVPALAAGASKEFACAVDLPADPAQGLDVYAVVDEAGAVAEFDEVNNRSRLVVTAGRLLALTSPHGGESWAAGSAQAIVWTQTNLTGAVAVELYQGGTKVLDVGTADVTAGYLAWTVPFAQASGENYRIRLVLGGVEAWSTDPFAITGVCQAPVVASSPLSASLCEGAADTLVVLASGSAPLHFQWYRGEAGDRSYPVGGDAASFPVAVPEEAASYWVEVTNACGQAESLAARLTPLSPTVIETHPADGWGNAGTSVTLTVEATGESLAYQWYRGQSGDTSQAVAGATGPSLRVTVAPLLHYWVKVTGACGAANSRTVLVSVSEDVDGNGLVNGADLSLLARYLAGSMPAGAFYPGGADVNHDGRTDILDLVLLKRTVGAG